MSDSVPPTLRERCVEALHDVLHQYEPVHPDVVEKALDALLPVLSQALKPHRWDHTYEDARPAACAPKGPDTFYNGVLHAAAVVRNLMEPVDRPSADSAPSRLCRLCGAFAAAGECIDVEACRLRRDSADSAMTSSAPQPDAGGSPT